MDLEDPEHVFINNDVFGIDTHICVCGQLVKKVSVGSDINDTGPLWVAKIC